MERASSVSANNDRQGGLPSVRVMAHGNDERIDADAGEPRHPAAKRVVELVMERLGFHDPGELARELGLPAYKESSVRLVRRWLAGQNSPSFEHLMPMLSRAGLLAREADLAWKGLLAQPERLSENDDRLEEDLGEGGEEWRAKGA